MGRKKNNRKSKTKQRKRARSHDAPTQHPTHSLASPSASTNQEQTPALIGHIDDAGHAKTPNAVAHFAAGTANATNFVPSPSSASLSQQILSLPLPGCGEKKSDSCQEGGNDVASATECVALGKKKSNADPVSADDSGSMESDVSISEGEVTCSLDEKSNSDPSDQYGDLVNDSARRKINFDPSDQCGDMGCDESKEKSNSDPSDQCGDMDCDESKEKTNSDPSDQYGDMDCDSLQASQSQSTTHRVSSTPQPNWGSDIDDENEHKSQGRTRRGQQESSGADDFDQQVDSYFDSWDLHGNHDHVHHDDDFTWTRVEKKSRRKKSRRVKRHNPACLILDFKKGVDGTQVQQRIWQHVVLDWTAGEAV